MGECVFCQIAAGTIPADIVARTPEAIAFRDLNPQAPHHVLVIPIKHVAAVRDAGEEADRDLLGHLLQFGAEVATSLGLDEGGYRIVTNTGAGAGQSVFHLHLHVMGGRAFGWPPG